MIVYTLAMLAFAWHLAARVPGGTSAKAEEREELREGVLVGGAQSRTATADGGPTRDDPAPGSEQTPESRQRGSIALMLTYLGTLLLVASVLMRGLAVGRPPWGNMFEFATAGAAAASLAYCLLARRRHWEWLRPLLVRPIPLTPGPAVFPVFTQAPPLMPAP